MLSEEEKAFVRYWEANRGRRKKIFRQFLIGIPVGLALAIPIVINFLSHWDKRADMEAGNPLDFNPVVLLVALLLIVGFTAIFYQRFKWDQYEQRYRELRSRDPEHPDENTTPPRLD